MKTIKPNQKYLSKLIIWYTLIALAVVLFIGWMLFMIWLDERFNLMTGMTILLGCNLLWYIPALLLAGPYYNSIHYEIHEDEVIVHIGIITKSIKHVPFRTVTNITAKRGLLDRMLGIGSLEIQTAGMSGQKTAAEEQLVGLPNVQEIYELVAMKLRKFRGAMPPTNVGEEFTGSSTQVLQEILVEMKEIKDLLAG
ncbi:MAG: PH domain-containing protein [Anaerolineales bacterium]|nr:PH domain-containing protein [Anaerolineales bacterium]